MSEHLPIHLEDRFKEAWGLFVKSPEVFVTIAFGQLAVSMLFATLPVLGQLTGPLILFLSFAAYYLAADECARTGTATFDSLKALPALFPQLLTLFVVSGILISLGFVLLVIPGIYIFVVLSFSGPFVAIEKKSYLDAMRASRGLVRGNWFRVFGLLLILSMLAFSGALLVGIGLLFTLPFSAVVFYCVFRRSHVQVVG